MEKVMTKRGWFHRETSRQQLRQVLCTGMLDRKDGGRKNTVEQSSITKVGVPYVHGVREPILKEFRDHWEVK